MGIAREVTAAKSMRRAQVPFAFANGIFAERPNYCDRSPVRSERLGQLVNARRDAVSDGTKKLALGGGVVYRGTF